MRVLVCGGRDFSDYASVEDQLGRLKRDDLVIIEGAARGADEMAARWAKRYGVRCESYPADWKCHGRAAGPLRNRRMLEEGKPDLVLAFPGGRGTESMMRQAEQAGVAVVEVPPAKRDQYGFRLFGADALRWP